MRGFTMVSPNLWRSKRWADLSDDCRLAGLYLLTNEHNNSAGCYRLLPGYACADLRWEMGRYLACLRELEQAEIILVDGETNELMIQRWFQHCAPANEKHLKGTWRLIAAIDSPKLRQATGEALNAALDLRTAERAAKNSAEKSADVTALSDALKNKMKRSG